jgi:hypothetical protein
MKIKHIFTHPGSLFKEWCIIFFLILGVFNSFQSIRYFERANMFLKVGFIVVSLIILLLLIFFVYRSIKMNGVIKKIFDKFLALSIPRGAKIAIIVVFIGNLISIGIAKPRFPFYDVGMFRWSTKFSNPDKILYSLKYYYWKDGSARIFDIRKESILLFAENLGWGYSHEFTFSAAYHNKGQVNNFLYLAELMKERGIDTLWVGVQSVNYATGDVMFDTDICNAIELNQTKNIHYGPIYIPGYQIKQCQDENH